MNFVIGSYFQPLWNKIVFHSGVNLNYISSLASNVDIVDIAVGWYVVSSIFQYEHVWSILEGSAKLCWVDGQSQWKLVENFHYWVFFYFISKIFNNCGEL